MKRKPLKFIHPDGSVALLLALFPSVTLASADPRMTAHFIDVGQAGEG